MTPREQGFLLLTSHLGDPQRKVLTVAQFRALTQRVRASVSVKREGELTEDVLVSLGYNRLAAQRILTLLSENERLTLYLRDAADADCLPLTRVSNRYPLVLRKRLGLDSSGCLWLKGDPTLLDTPMIALVGCRELNEKNRAFAEEAGKQAALQGITLVSGNARGADTAAQEACLAHGGNVISVIADSLRNMRLRERVLYISEDCYELPFSTQRALSRNRVIHALGYMTFVAQSENGFGGTWDGTQRNLRNLWSPVFCYDDGSDAVQELNRMGAALIGTDHLRNYASLLQSTKNLFDINDLNGG